ncbi:MAG: diguanylate cyclase [Ruminococcus sp.]|nr:diguanylate cyclase [Ruminococcus sp.]
MRQFQFVYSGPEQLRTELLKIRQWCASSVYSHIVFQIFTESLDTALISYVCDTIRSELPKAQFFGCSTNGNILTGSISPNEIGLACTIFEYPSTRSEMYQFPLSSETEEETMDALVKLVSERPWVKAIELLTTIRGMSMTGFCERLGEVRDDIQIFGGGAFSSDIYDNAACVFSRDGGISKGGVVFWLIGGDDFNVVSTYISGWKPLGKTFHVTRSKGSILYELDNMPAYEVYYKYLNIRNNEHFFYNTLEFPFLFHHNGISILRAPTASNPDGSLTMTSDIEENVLARLAYGDPWTILESVQKDGSVFKNFQPEVIQIFSCAARRTFWGNAEVSKESMPFQNIAPTSGFYTSSEFLRTDGFVNQHNVTMVIAGMREGPAASVSDGDLEIDQTGFSGKVSLINRLASYINAAFDELEQSAITDGLTKLYNRAEVQRRIAERLATGKELSLIMIDIDDFKSVNDTYGHQEGDNVIIGLADLLRRGIAAKNPDASAGRWGGEEFMLMLPYDKAYAELAAADICKDFAAISFPKADHQTISLGVTSAIDGESLDELLLRVDSALYKAKKSGKNRFVTV